MLPSYIVQSLGFLIEVSENDRAKGTLRLSDVWHPMSRNSALEGIVSELLPYPVTLNWDRKGEETHQIPLTINVTGYSLLDGWTLVAKLLAQLFSVVAVRVVTGTDVLDMLETMDVETVRKIRDAANRRLS